MEKSLVSNRKGQKMSVVIEQGEPGSELVFVMHGLGGFKEQRHIQTFADAFRERGFSVVTFDTTNSIGESDGSYEDATLTNYYEDLEDVVAWAKQQPWYQEPFWLVGQSLAAISVVLYAIHHPGEVKALAPISVVVSGKLSIEASHSPQELDDWHKHGILVRPSNSKPGVIERLKYSHIEDRLKYDLLPDAGKVKIPILLVVGEEDVPTPPRHVRLLYDALSCDKEFHVIPGAPHTFKEQTHLVQARDIIGQWIDRLYAHENKKVR